MAASRDIFRTIPAAEAPNSGAASYVEYQKVSDGGQLTDTSYAKALPGSTSYFTYNITPAAWVLPSKSFFKIKAQILNGSGDSLTRSDGLSYARNFMAAFIKQFSWILNGQTIETINQSGLQDTMSYLAYADNPWFDTTGTDWAWKKWLAGPFSYMSQTPTAIAVTTLWTITDVVGFSRQRITFNSPSAGFFTQEMVGQTLILSNGTAVTIRIVEDGLNVIPWQNGLTLGSQAGNVTVVMANTEMPEIFMEDRIQDVVDGKVIEFYYRPPAAFWDMQEAIRTGQIQMQISWNPQMYQAAIDTVGSIPVELSTSPGSGDYSWNVLSFDLWMATVAPDAKIPKDQLEQWWSLNMATTQIQQVVSTSSQLTFTVPRTTFKIYVAFRKNERDLGGTADPPLSYTQFDPANLTQLQLAVPTAGISIPPLQYSFSPALELGAVDRAYNDFIKNSVGPCWMPSAGQMDLEDWLELYPIFCFPLTLPLGSRVEQVQVLSTHSSLPENTSCILMACFQGVVHSEYDLAGQAKTSFALE